MYFKDAKNLQNKAQPLAEFGENFGEFYHKPQQAIAKLLQEKRGQVAGAFHKEGLGDIDLVWGDAGSGKSDGYGLAKIAKYHPEVLDILYKLVAKLPIVKESPNRYQLENDIYKIAIRKDFEGERRNWILTAFEKKKSTAKRRTDLSSTQRADEKTTSSNTYGHSTTSAQKSSKDSAKQSASLNSPMNRL